MAGTISKTILVGNVGQDPKISYLSNTEKCASFSIATSETWKDKATGERKERTEWHRIVVFNQNLVSVVENYVRKGSKVYVEGRNETRSWDKDGRKYYTTEVVLRPYRGEIKLLDRKDDTYHQPDRSDQYNEGYVPPPQSSNSSELEDEIPF